MTTSSPASARRPAHTSPAGPAPMTTTSQLRSLMASSQSGCDSRYKAVASSADASPCPRARPRRRGRAVRPADRVRARRRPTRPPMRRRAPTTTRAARRPAAGPRGGRAAECAWSRSATSRPPSTSPRRPATSGGIFVVEQAGEIVVVRGGKPEAQPFLDIRRRSRPAASRACSRWPSRRTTRSRGCSTSTTPRRAATRRSGSTAAPAPTAPTPTAPGSCCAWTTPSPTTTAA